jgi:hypothetical protein
MIIIGIITLVVIFVGILVAFLVMGVREDKNK